MLSGKFTHKAGKSDVEVTSVVGDTVNYTIIKTQAVKSLPMIKFLQLYGKNSTLIKSFSFLVNFVGGDKMIPIGPILADTADNALAQITKNVDVEINKSELLEERLVKEIPGLVNLGSF